MPDEAGGFQADADPVRPSAQAQQLSTLIDEARG